jgi:hypothetical protein
MCRLREIILVSLVLSYVLKLLSYIGIKPTLLLSLLNIYDVFRQVIKNTKIIGRIIATVSSRTCH